MTKGPNPPNEKPPPVSETSSKDRREPTPASPPPKDVFVFLPPTRGGNATAPPGETDAASMLPRSFNQSSSVETLAAFETCPLFPGVVPPDRPPPAKSEVVEPVVPRFAPGIVIFVPHFGHPITLPTGTFPFNFNPASHPEQRNRNTADSMGAVMEPNPRTSEPATLGHPPENQWDKTPGTPEHSHRLTKPKPRMHEKSPTMHQFSQIRHAFTVQHPIPCGASRPILRGHRHSF